MSRGRGGFRRKGSALPALVVGPSQRAPRSTVGMTMTRALACALSAGLLLAASAVSAAAAPGISHLSGGGTASFSQVAMNVSINASGSASGSFECLMAGRSAFILTNFPGLEHNMIVHATPIAGSVNGSIVTFRGPARLTLDGNQHMDVHVHVWVDVATQSFELTVDEIGPMGPESLLSGGVALG
jgi:hypothetical protein